MLLIVVVVSCACDVIIQSKWPKFAKVWENNIYHVKVGKVAAVAERSTASLCVADSIPHGTNICMSYRQLF